MEVFLERHPKQECSVLFLTVQNHQPEKETLCWLCLIEKHQFQRILENKILHGEKINLGELSTPEKDKENSGWLGLYTYIYKHTHIHLTKN